MCLKRVSFHTSTPIRMSRLQMGLVWKLLCVPEARAQISESDSIVQAGLGSSLSGFSSQSLLFWWQSRWRFCMTHTGNVRYTYHNPYFASLKWRSSALFLFPFAVELGTEDSVACLLSIDDSSQESTHFASMAPTLYPGAKLSMPWHSSASGLRVWCTVRCSCRSKGNCAVCFDCLARPQPPAMCQSRFRRRGACS